ncbi:MAG: zinc ribbon domain-containing protein [Nocardioides sp.]
MATVCSTCGEQNAPDAQFCVSCRSYLGWQDPVPLAQRADDDKTVIADPPSAGRDTDETAPLPPSTPRERDPFEVGIEVADAAVTVDGAPTTVTIDVANTSPLVDSYLVVAVDAPSWLEVTPGRAELLPATSGTVTAELRIVSRNLVPAQHLPLVLRVSNTTGRSTYRDVPVDLTVPVVTAPIALRAEPRLLRAHDASPGVCKVVVSNAGSNRWAQVRLSTTDPEQVVRATWTSPQLQVPPGGEESTEVRFEAPLPEPGGEVSRTITIVAREGHRTAETTVTFTQSASHAAIDMLALRLDPSVLRLGGRRRGRLTAVVDNRRGTAPAAVALSGADPEKSLRFEFSPGSLQVDPGQEARVSVTVSAPRTQPGQEMTRPFTVAASDGRADTRAEGSLIQLASPRRGLARVVLTVLGGLLLLLGAANTLVRDTDRSGFGMTAEHLNGDLGTRNPNWGLPDHLAGGGTENVVSIGLVLLVLAALMVFGLTGTSGKLTRVSALFGLAVVVGSVAALSYSRVDYGHGPAAGAFVAGLGCVVAYAGGMLARR